MAAFNSSQAWANMAQYMRDAIAAQGAGREQAFPMFGKAMAGMRGSGIPFPGGKSRQPTPLGTPVGARQLAMMMAPNASQQVSTTTSVVSPGQTQVVRPSQQPARRPSAPQAGASSSLITEAPSPAEVALATTSLLGG